mmetsp:Transcript_66067/g.175082  ORF Transcript_66067/g.175082 Transcript_66067/m.175082 type:complete len:286 (-) Transcript_66067:360-1217(-)
MPAWRRQLRQSLLQSLLFRPRSVQCPERRFELKHPSAPRARTRTRQLRPRSGLVLLDNTRSRTEYQSHRPGAFDTIGISKCCGVITDHLWGGNLQHLTVCLPTELSRKTAGVPVTRGSLPRHNRQHQRRQKQMHGYRPIQELERTLNGETSRKVSCPSSRSRDRDPRALKNLRLRKRPGNRGLSTNVGRGTSQNGIKEVGTRERGTKEFGIKEFGSKNPGSKELAPGDQRSTNTPQALPRLARHVISVVAACIFGMTTMAGSVARVGCRTTTRNRLTSDRRCVSV